MTQPSSRPARQGRAGPGRRRRGRRGSRPCRDRAAPRQADESGLVARALLGPGDVAVVESPTFAGTLASLQATGARVLPLPVDADGPDVDALDRVLARHEIKLVAVQASCQNPTGADLSPARRARLLELARTRSFFVLDDGAYATMRYEGEPLQRLRAEAPSHVIYVDSLSNTIGGCPGPFPARRPPATRSTSTARSLYRRAIDIARSLSSRTKTSRVRPKSLSVGPRRRTGL